MSNSTSRTFKRPFYQQGTMDKLVTLATYSLFFLLSWYHNTSGQIQPVDLSVIITFLLIAFSNKFFGISLIRYSHVYFALISFLIYAVVRLSTGYIHTGDETLLYSVFESGYHIVLLLTFVSLLFYLFSFLTFTKFYETILCCFVFATFLPCIDMIIKGQSDGRAFLTFNNANQLGFFALVNLCCFFYMVLFAHSNGIKIKKFPSLFIININILFLFLSESRAAAVAIVPGILSYPFIFKFKLSKGIRTVFWIITCLIGVIAIAKNLFDYMQLSRGDMTFISWTSLFDDIYARAIAGVGYNLTHITYFIFGYGADTNPWRPERLEFHNNFLFIFNQLGLLGLLGYLYIISRILFGLFRKGIFYTLPFLCYLFYSNLQYAFRTRSNWLLFAFIIFVLLCSRKNIKKERNSSLILGSVDNSLG